MQRISNNAYQYPPKISSENESNFGYAPSGHSINEITDMRIRGYFSKPKGGCEQTVWETLDYVIIIVIVITILQ